jgi:photosystem II stability/assembly factor-like uncharacterized protein
MKIIFTIVCFLLIVSIQSSFSQWEVCNYGLKDSAIHVIKTNANNIFAGTCRGGVFRSTNGGNSWEEKNNGRNYPVTSFAFDENRIFASTLGGIYLSTNNGEDWVRKDSGLSGIIIITDIATRGKYVYASSGEGLWVSSDFGDSWVRKRISQNPFSIKSVSIIDTNIFVGMYNFGLYKSTDNGDSWVQKTNGMTDYEGISTISVYGNDIYAGTKSGHIYFTSNLGDNWLPIFKDMTNFSISSIVVHDNIIICGCDSMLYDTTNHSVNGSIFISTDNGNIWYPKNDGITEKPIGISSITIKDNEIFAGTLYYTAWEDCVCWAEGRGIYKAKISDFLTNITEKPETISSLSISPNPSSNTITINYPEKMYGEPIKIFNTMGIPVWSGIADGERKMIEVSNLPAGAYFMRLGKETGIFVKE